MNNAKDNLLRPGYPRAIRANNPKAKVLQPPIQAIPGLRRASAVGLHSGPFKIEVQIIGKCRADIDNVLKGILDALNGVAYSDDKNCVDARVFRGSGDGLARG